MSATNMPLFEAGVLDANVSPNITLTKADKLLREVAEVTVSSPTGFSFYHSGGTPVPWPADTPLVFKLHETLDDPDNRVITKVNFTGAAALSWLVHGAELNCHA